MPSLGSERATVQSPLIAYAVDIGWTYLRPDEAVTLRRGESGTLLYPVLRDRLISLNPCIITAPTVDEVIGRSNICADTFCVRPSRRTRWS